jgi:hypothetical protein
MTSVYLFKILVQQIQLLNENSKLSQITDTLQFHITPEKLLMFNGWKVVWVPKIVWVW